MLNRKNVRSWIGKQVKIISVFLCLVLFLTACTEGRTDVKAGDSHIYCLNADRTGVVKVSYEFPEGDALEKAESVLHELKQPADEIEYTPVFPEKVEVKECTLQGSILNVDFGSGYLELESLEEKLVRAAVVQSLVQIEEINAVSFSVEGEPLRDSENNIVGLMNEDDFVENTGSSLSSYQTATLVLYFANEAGDKLVEQKTDVRYSSNVPKEKLIVEKLLQGPKGDDTYPAINPDTNLLGVTIKDEICYVNFDSTFLTAVYDVVPEVTIYSIVNSLVEGTGADMVQITINGESSAKYMEKVDLSKPLKRNDDWVTAEEKK